MDTLPDDIIKQIFRSFSTSLSEFGSGYFLWGPVFSLVNKQWYRVSHENVLRYLWHCHMNIDDNSLGIFEPIAKKRRNGQVLKSVMGSRTVAIKALTTDKSETLISRFKILSQIKHPNLIFYFGMSNSVGNQIFFVAEFCPKKSLYDIMQSSSKMVDWTLFTKIGRDIARGLHVLHTWSPTIVHENLRSKHLLLSETGKAKLTDVEYVFSVCPHQISLTESFDYSAPEVCQQQCYTPSSDVYSLGIILWEMANCILKGRYARPYESLPGYQVLIQVGQGTLRPKIPLDFPKIIRDLISDCLKWEPKQRPSTQEIIQYMKEFRKHLNEKQEEWFKLAELLS